MMSCQAAAHEPTIETLRCSQQSKAAMPLYDSEKCTEKKDVFTDFLVVKKR